MFIWRNLDPAILAAVLIMAARRYAGNRVESGAVRQGAANAAALKPVPDRSRQSRHEGRRV
jgi:hypothetical protein